MNDYLVRALAFNGQVRAYAVSTTNTVAEAQRRHDTWRTASAALGRAMTAGVMMGAMQKGDAKITISIEGDGPLGPIIVDANANGEVRGYVTNPHVDFASREGGKLDVRRAVGTEGTLSVVKDVGMKDNFSGRVPLVSGELGEDFTYYFALSEQTPSSVGVGVLVNGDDTISVAGGFIIQLLPDTDDAVITQIENSLNTMPYISELLQEGLKPEEILYQILGEENVKLLDTMPIKFECQCSKDRYSRAIIGLGKEEIQDMIETEGGIEAQCHFCNETYAFSEEELEELKKEAK